MKEDNDPVYLKLNESTVGKVESNSRKSLTLIQRNPNQAHPPVRKRTIILIVTSNECFFKYINVLYQLKCALN